MQYAEVAPTIPLSTNRQTFTYRIPDSVKELDAVSISFGPRHITGLVIKTKQPKPPYPTKDAAPLTNPQSVTKKQYEFAQWLVAYMRGGLGYTLRLFLGPHVEQKKEKSSKKINQPQLLLEKDTKKRYQTLKTISLKAIIRHEQVLILVPEVSHIQQLQEFFDSPHVVTVFAGQKQSLKTKVWETVGNGQPMIVIGTQKALFLPWQNLGLVILEQAQYQTHKLWDQYPRLDNRYGAEQLAAIHKATYVMSGSTPSLLMWHAQETKAVEVLRNNPYLKTPTVISPTFEDKKNRRLVPTEVATLIQRTLKKKQRIFVLYNKRGLWQAMRCRKCHSAVRCPDCDVVALVQGKGKVGKDKKSIWQLVCRSCNRRIPTPAICPTCQHPKLAPTRLGGVTMQSILAALNPGQKIDRLDADSLHGISPEKIKTRITHSNLIIGTNAALTHLEGHTFDRVIWLFPEDALSYPDVRSSERAYLLAARIGALSPHPLIVVTKQPQLVADTIGQNPIKFLEKQLKERQRLQYPPFSDLVRLTFQSGKQTQASKARLELKKRLGSEAKIRGPYQGIDQSKKSQAQTHMLVTGKLSALQAAYQDIPCDMIDIAPDRII